MLDILKQLVQDIEDAITEAEETDRPQAIWDCLNDALSNIEDALKVCADL